METVRVIARAEAAEGKAEELKQLLVKLVLPSRSEQGCRYYELFESNQPGVFYCNELWNSKADLEAHAATPHFNAVMAQVKQRVRVPLELNILTELQ